MKVIVSHYAVIFILILLIIPMAQATTKLYKVSGHNTNDAWELSNNVKPYVTKLPPIGVELLGQDYNDTRFTDGDTMVYSGISGLYPLVLFRVNVTVDNPTQLNISVHGKAISSGSGWELYIWNFTNGAYDLIDTSNRGEPAETLNYSTGAIDDYVNSTNHTVIQAIATFVESGGTGGSPQLWVDGKFIADMTSWSITAGLTETNYYYFETNSTYIDIIERHPQETAHIKELKIYEVFGNGSFIADELNPRLYSVNSKIKCDKVADKGYHCPHSGGNYRIIIESHQQFDGVKALLTDFWDNMGGNNEWIITLWTGLIKNDMLRAMDENIGVNVYADGISIGNIRGKGDALGLLSSKPNYGNRFQDYVIADSNPDNVLIRLDYDTRMVVIGNVYIDSSPQNTWLLNTLHTDYIPFEITEPENKIINFEKGTGKYLLMVTSWHRNTAYMDTEVSFMDMVDYYLANIHPAIFDNYDWVKATLDDYNGHQSISIDSFNLTVEYAQLTDNDAPLVTLVSPLDNAEFTTGSTIDFRYDYVEYNHTLSCSLYIDGVLDTTQNLPDEYFNNSIIITPSGGYHNWSIGCEDTDGNIGMPSNRTIMMTIPPNITQNQNFSNFTAGLGYNINSSANDLDNDINRCEIWHRRNTTRTNIWDIINNTRNYPNAQISFNGSFCFANLSIHVPNPLVNISYVNESDEVSSAWHENIRADEDYVYVLSEDNNIYKLDKDLNIVLSNHTISNYAVGIGGISLDKEFIYFVNQSHVIKYNKTDLSPVADTRLVTVPLRQFTDLESNGTHVFALQTSIGNYSRFDSDLNLEASGGMVSGGNDIELLEGFVYYKNGSLHKVNQDTGVMIWKSETNTFATDFSYDPYHGYPRWIGGKSIPPNFGIYEIRDSDGAESLIKWYDFLVREPRSVLPFEDTIVFSGHTSSQLQHNTLWFANRSDLAIIWNYTFTTRITGMTNDSDHLYISLEDNATVVKLRINASFYRENETIESFTRFIDNLDLINDTTYDNYTMPPLIPTTTTTTTTIPADQCVYGGSGDFEIDCGVSQCNITSPITISGGNIDIIGSGLLLVKAVITGMDWININECHVICDGACFEW